MKIVTKLLIQDTLMFFILWFFWILGHISLIINDQGRPNINILIFFISTKFEKEKYIQLVCVSNGRKIKLHYNISYIVPIALKRSWRQSYQIVTWERQVTMKKWKDSIIVKVKEIRESKILRSKDEHRAHFEVGNDESTILIEQVGCRHISMI